MYKMKKETIEEKTQESNYSNMVYNNTILLSLDCWTKFIEGFIKGLQSCDKVNTSSVLDCIGEILEFITSFKATLVDLFNHCEDILEENNELREKLRRYEELEVGGDNNGENM